MKYLFAFLFIFASLPETRADSAALCSIFHVKKVMAKATARLRIDKNYHCSVSCMLALKCAPEDVLMIGILKELKDAVGPGNAEMADLKADILGIDLVLARRAKTDQQCLSECDLYY